ncbi:sensor domain-containing diguanylate cyclase [Bacilliculturomica massiliensis]|uniref:sensor domain-containing diguanylate cyclase n=1 Tax=Bacilliculturomica massiliensis TaxID=1917867 RepID=UPI001030A0BF|nr:sensor domain-containing diguanylate cyclase [Bacilliculturomica massiliensis]
MKKNILFRTNALICLIIIAGFLVTAVLSYRANYSASLENIEQVSVLTSEGIYHQMASVFTKPVNVSLTMANDSLLKEYLMEEPDHLEDQSYTDTISGYLMAYKVKYGYDSVFLVSTGSHRYYNFNGVDRIIAREGGVDDNWYYNMLAAEEEYLLNVDTDKVAGVNNEITVFVDCKIRGDDGAVLGIVGVGLQIDHLQALLKEYVDKFGVNAFLVDESGDIQISSDHTGYEKENFFALCQFDDEVKNAVLDWKEEERTLNLWVAGGSIAAKKDYEDYVVTRFIPELSWHLIVERDTKALVGQLQKQLYETVAVIFGIIVLILIVITHMIKGFNRQITRLTEEQQESFRRVTEQMYDNIYELNITENRAAGPSTERYFESMGAPKDMPFDQALKVIAEKQIREDFREGYISTFTPENVMREYQNGNNHLSYDFVMTENGSDYYWLRIDAYIYYLERDHSVRMFVYRKNVDAEKRQEILMNQRLQIDEMTGMYNKMATERHMMEKLQKEEGAVFAFYILDIDSFKQANDLNGHAFGDQVIVSFTETVRGHFGAGDVLGRIGGDEFAVLAEVRDRDEAVKKAGGLCRALDQDFVSGKMSWHMTASIGVALYPDDAEDFEQLYRRADEALYQTKKKGKNGFTVYGQAAGGRR